MILSKNKYENIFSAPIAGYTNYPLRKLFSHFGAFRIFSEMVHVREILNRNIDEIPLIKVPYKFTIQLFGSFDDDFIDAAKVAFDFCDNVDINCGCPVKKVIKSKGGAFWLSDIENFSKKIYQISDAFPYKVSVKIRLGFNNIELDEILKSIEKAKLAFITVHLRTAKMMFSGKALYEQTENIKGFSIPIILNGDITNPEIAKNILGKYDCSGIMIGRAAITDPSIFENIRNYFKFGRYEDTTSTRRIENCIKYIDNLFEYLDILKDLNKTNSERQIRNSIIESRKIIFSLSKKLPYSQNLKEKILKISSFEDLLELKNFLNKFKTNILLNDKNLKC